MANILTQNNTTDKQNAELNPTDVSTNLQTQQQEAQPVKDELQSPDKFQREYFYPFVIDPSNKRIRPNFSSSARFLKLLENFYINGTLKADATISTIIGTAPETIINSYTIPAHFISNNRPPLDKGGNVFRITASGIYTTTTDMAVCNIYAKVNNTVVNSLGIGGKMAADYPFFIEWLIMTKNYYWTTFFTARSKERNTSLSINFDSSSDFSVASLLNDDITLSLNASWANSSSSDSITIRQFLVELLN